MWCHHTAWFHVVDLLARHSCVFDKMAHCHSILPKPNICAFQTLSVRGPPGRRIYTSAQMLFLCIPSCHEQCREGDHNLSLHTSHRHHPTRQSPDSDVQVSRLACNLGCTTRLPWTCTPICGERCHHFQETTVLDKLRSCSRQLCLSISHFRRIAVPRIHRRCSPRCT